MRIVISWPVVRIIRIYYRLCFVEFLDTTRSSVEWCRSAGNLLNGNGKSRTQSKSDCLWYSALLYGHQHSDRFPLSQVLTLIHSATGLAQAVQ